MNPHADNVHKALRALVTKLRGLELATTADVLQPFNQGTAHQGTALMCACFTPYFSERGARGHAETCGAAFAALMAAGFERWADGTWARTRGEPKVELARPALNALVQRLDGAARALDRGHHKAAKTTVTGVATELANLPDAGASS